MTAPQKDTAWLNARKGGIGGSEITAVLGLDTYETPYSLWERKTGRRQSSPDNKFTRAGNYLESAVAQMFSDETGLEIYEPEGKHFRHPEYDFLLGTPDRFVSLKHGDGVLEIKTTQKRGIDRENLPLSWFFQVQWYMGITGKKTGYVAWLSSGIDFDFIQVEFEAALFQDMVEQAINFWENHVLANVPPPPIRREDIMKIVGEVKPEAVEAPDEIVRYHETIKANKAKIKELEEANDCLIEAVQLLMMEKEVVTWRGSTLFTWKQQRRKSLDTKELAGSEPELYERLRERYEKETSVRVFLTK